MNRAEEDLLSGRTIFTLLEVPWKLSSRAWRFIPTRLAFSLLIALVFLPSYSLADRIAYGFLYAGLVLASQFVHVLGHTLSSKVVGSPMAANVIMDTKILTYYAQDPDVVPAKIHIARALGGPLLSGLAGVIGLLLWLDTSSHGWLFFALINAVLSLGVLLPFPGVDGEVVWRELRRKG